MRQLSLAMHNYESAFGNFPPGNKTAEITGTGIRDITFGDVLRRPGLNWQACILPYVEQAPLFDRVNDVTNNLTDPNAAYTNEEIAMTVIPNFICPSCPMDDLNDVRPDAFGDDGDAAKCNYVGIWGTEAAGDSNYTNFGNEDRYDPSVYSGILFLNSEVAAATWCGGREANFANQCLGPISGMPDQVLNSVEDNKAAQWNAISSQHPGGANFGRADGSVEYVTDAIDPSVYEEYGTKAGGEVNRACAVYFYLYSICGLIFEPHFFLLPWVRL